MYAPSVQKIYVVKLMENHECNCNELEDDEIDKIDADVKLRLLNKRFDLLDYEFEKIN